MKKITLLTVGALVLFCGPASAQQKTSPKPVRRTGWVFDIHVGAAAGGMPTKVRFSQLPAQGPGFTTQGGTPSRRVPSWYFGDGVALANTSWALFGGTARIVPLDAILTSPAATRQSGTDFGVRIGHTITGRVLLLFSIDRVPARVSLSSTAVTAVNATNSSLDRKSVV